MNAHVSTYETGVSFAISEAEKHLCNLLTQIAEARRELEGLLDRKLSMNVDAPKAQKPKAKRKGLKAETGPGLTPDGAIFIGHEGQVMQAKPTRLPNGKVMNLVYCPDGYNRDGTLKPFVPTAHERKLFKQREAEYRRELQRRKEAANA